MQSFSEFQEPLDYLIVDAAAGIAPSVTTFLKACHQTMVVVRDEPSSIADAYGIIKVLTTEHDYQHRINTQWCNRSTLGPVAIPTTECGLRKVP